MALPIIESLLGEGKIPVICGGTNYYIESLLWKILIDDSDDRYDHVHCTIWMRQDLFNSLTLQKSKI